MIVVSVLIYFSVFAISCFFVGIYQHIKKDKKTILSKTLWLGLIIFFPVLLASIRQNIGTDYINYVKSFNIYRDTDIHEYLGLLIESPGNVLEPVFFFVYKVSDYIFGDAIGVFLISSWLTLVFLIKTIDKFKEKFSLALSLFIYFMMYYQMSFNIIRNAIAYSIVLYAITHIPIRNFKGFLGLIFFATLFHRSAIVFIILYLVIFIKSKKVQKVYCSMILILPFFIHIVFGYIYNLPYFVRYAIQYNIDFSRFFIGNTLIYLPVLIPMLFLFKNIKDDLKVFFNIYLLVIPLSIISNYFEYGFRIVIYVSFVEVLLVPMFISSFQKIENRLALKFYYISWYLAYYTFYYIISNFNSTYPYMSILFRLE